MNCNICGETYQGFAMDCRCTNYGRPPFYLLNIFLCSVGYHKWTISSEPGVEWCSRFCQKRRCRDGCLWEDYEIVHRDDAKSLEQCKKCGHEVNGI